MLATIMRLSTFLVHTEKRTDVLGDERFRNQEGRYKATLKREFKLPLLKAGPLKSSR